MTIKKLQDTRDWRIFCGGLGLLSLLVGVAFYASMRPPQFWISWAPRLPEIPLPAPMIASMPSFVHVIAFACMTAAVTLHPRRSIAIWTAVALGWEALQGVFPYLGTFDPLDVIGCLLGAAFCWPLGVFSPQAKIKSSRLIKIPIILVGSSALMATSRVPMDVETTYLSYSKIRNAFRVDPPRSVQKSGKILAFGDYLFVSEPYLGVHVFANTDPTNPKPVAFLNLPGNIDLAAKDKTLYADSFSDLVAIEFKEGTFVVAHRELDVFLPDSALCWNESCDYWKNGPYACEDVDKEPCFIVGSRIKN